MFSSSVSWVLVWRSFFPFISDQACAEFGGTAPAAHIYHAQAQPDLRTVNGTQSDIKSHTHIRTHARTRVIHSHFPRTRFVTCASVFFFFIPSCFLLSHIPDGLNFVAVTPFFSHYAQRD